MVFRLEEWVREKVGNKVIAGLAYMTFLLGIILLLFFAWYNLGVGEHESRAGAGYRRQVATELFDGPRPSETPGFPLP